MGYVVESDETNMIYRQVEEVTLLYILGVVNLAKLRRTRAQRRAPISVRTSHPPIHCYFPRFVVCVAQSQQESIPSIFCFSSDG